METYPCVIYNAANNYVRLVSLEIYIYTYVYILSHNGMASIKLVSLLNSVFQVFNSKCSLYSHYFLSD
jgi:hypothetical protein